MGHSTPIAPSASSTARGERADYRLHSDIAQLCLPGATKDATQKLAYVNSICIIVLTMGFIGIKAPQLVKQEPPQVVESMPVEIVQIEPQKPPEPELVPETEPPPDAPVDLPQIATVVAADPSQVKFAVPVEGPVVFAPAKYAQAPPANPPKATSKIIKFTGTDGGTYPVQEYPAWARRQDQPLEGTATLIITVKPDGSVASVEILSYTGSYRLAKSAADWIQSRYRFPPLETEEMRHYEKPVEFKLNR